MSFSDLKKEQKQLVILGVMGLVTAISVVSNLIIGPQKEKAAKARAAIKEFKSQVQTGDIILQRDIRNIAEIEEFSQEVLTINGESLPPQSSTYIWALEKLSLIAESVDLVIEVREHGSQRYRSSPPYEPNAQQVSNVTMWVPYSIDINMATSFANLQRFLDELRTELPYVSVGRITINAGGKSEQEHSIRLVVEWPSLRYPEDLEWLRSNIKEDSE